MDVWRITLKATECLGKITIEIGIFDNFVISKMAFKVNNVFKNSLIVTSFAEVVTCLHFKMHGLIRCFEVLQVIFLPVSSNLCVPVDKSIHIDQSNSK